MRKQNTFLVNALLTTVLLLGLSQVYAQDSTKYLTLREAIDAALTNNKAVQIAKLDEDIAASAYKETDAIYLPQIGFSYSAFGTNNPLNAFGFKLQQKSITQADFNPALLNRPDATSDFTTKLEVQQPLINMDMLYKRKAAAMQTDLYKYKTLRTREYITFEVEKAYLQLQLAYDALAVLQDALQTTQAVYKFTNDYYKQGLLQKSDLLNAGLQVTGIQTNIAKAKSNVQNASDYIRLLMGDTNQVVYTVDKSGNVEPAKGATDLLITPMRADFMAMQKALDATDMMITATKKSYLPKLNAFGSYQLNDSQVFGFGANAWFAGVQLSWDIFKGNRTKNSIKTQKSQRDKLQEQLQQQKEQSQLELNKAYRDLSDARFDIKQQNAAIEQASEALQILQNRYQQGLVNTTDVLASATRVSQEKFSLVQAVFSAGITNAYIQFLTSSNNK